MPGRIPRPCKVRRCPHRTVLTHGYCEQHQDRQFVRPLRQQPKPRESGWARWQQRNGNVTRRGYGRAWQKLRDMVLKRDGYLCRVCKQAGRLTRASSVDHIKPKSRGGDNAMTNLQSLCDTCHRLKTQVESNARPCCGQLSVALAAQGIQS